MNCPQCDGRTGVYGTEGGTVSRIRYRECHACGHVFRTIETIMQEKKVKPRKLRQSPSVDEPGLFGAGFEP